jgi:uncharacterized protein (TIGR03437 family)
METVLGFKTLATSVLTTKAALDHWIRRIHTTKAISLVICLPAFAAFAQTTPANFSYQIGGTVPPAQQWSITTQFAPLNLTLFTTGDPWFLASLSSTVTPATLTISITPVGLTAGTYNGSVDVISANNTLIFNITLTVLPPLPPPSLTVSPSQLTFTTQSGSTNWPSAQTVSVTSTKGPVQVQVDTSLCLFNAGILITSTASSTTVISGGYPVTPATLSISMLPPSLPTGTYSCSIAITDATNPTNSVPVNIILSVTTIPPLTASPSSFTFNAVQGGPPPATQSLLLAVGTSTTAISAFLDAVTPIPSWLALNNFGSSAPLPATLSVAVNSSGLAPGTYSSSLRFYALMPPPQANTSVTVTITLIVSIPPPALKINTTQLQFQYLTGSPTPPPQPIQITSSGTQMSASVSLTVPWLTASSLNGTTPLTVNVGVNPTGMAVGTYNGQVIVNSASSPPQTVNVSLTITRDLRPVITSVVNGASFKAGVGPGAWVSILGSSLAITTTQVSAPFLTSLNSVSAQLSGVGGAYSLLMYYVSPTQINAFVPLELPPAFFGNSCNLAVTTSYGTSSYATQCQSLTPALFNYGTQHYASATHLDGTIVGVIPGTSPAQSGSIITLWGTGFGQTTPSTTTTSINYSGIGGVLASPVVISINNTPTTVLYAGMVGVGLYQFNIQLPDGLVSGDYPVTVQISGLTTDPVTLPIR